MLPLVTHTLYLHNIRKEEGGINSFCLQKGALVMSFIYTEHGFLISTLSISHIIKLLK